MVPGGSRRLEPKLAAANSTAATAAIAGPAVVAWRTKLYTASAQYSKIERLSSQPAQRVASVWNNKLQTPTPNTSQGRAQTSPGRRSPRAWSRACSRSSASAAATNAMLLRELSGSPSHPGASRSQYAETGSDHAMYGAKYGAN